MPSGHDLSSTVGHILAVSVRLTDTTSREDTRPAPGHGRLRWTHLYVDGTVRANSWLLAESWWAESFAPPSLRDLALWGTSVLPRTIGSHLGVALARTCRRWSAARLRMTPKVLARTGSLLLGMIASLGAMILLFGLLVIGLIPNPAVR